MPITKAIIHQAHKLTKLDKMPKGLKTLSRANVVLFDPAKTAGVDYNNEFVTSSKEDENNNAYDDEGNPDSDEEDDDDPDGE
eukprot:3124576-Ditylum_brightwellii.AAC.1